MEQLDAVAVTHGPGLAGALLVGLNGAKALALAQGLPLVGVNHLEAHVYAAWLKREDEELEEPASGAGFPQMCLVASGGHTDLVLMEGHGIYRLLGRDAGRCFRGGFRQGGPYSGAGLPRRAGNTAGVGRSQGRGAPATGLVERELRFQL